MDETECVFVSEGVEHSWRGGGEEGLFSSFKDFKINLGDQLCLKVSNKKGGKHTYSFNSSRVFSDLYINAD